MKNITILSIFVWATFSISLFADLALPWTKSKKIHPINDEIPTLKQVYEDYGKTINKKDGKTNVYQLRLTNDKKDALGDTEILGYEIME